MGAYGVLIKGRTGVPPSVEFWACSGAEIRNFYKGQWNEPPQLDQLLGAPATLVTLGVGGNDIGFDTIGRTCTDIPIPFGIMHGQGNPDFHNDCGTYLDQPGHLQPNTLIDGLTTGTPNAIDNRSYSLKGLYPDLRRNASLARVYVIGYPNPLPIPNAVSGDCMADVLQENGNKVGFGPYNQQFKIHQADVKWMEKILSRLNSAIQLNALDAGFYFVDNSLTLKDHDICGNGTDHWVHGVVVKNDGSTPSDWSFHPKAAGQKAIADVVASAVAGPSVGGFRSKVFPGGFVQQFLPVATGQLQLIVEVAWPGSDVQLSLVSPSGVVYDRTTQRAGVVHQLQSNGESLAVTNPEAGQWTIRLFGANVPSSGETVRVDTSQIPQSAFAPVAAIKMSTDRGVVPTTLQLDGSGSTSYNGASISSYQWDFGDGTPPASGVTTSHTFTTAGSHTVTLSVTDTNGQTDSAQRPVYFTATDQPPVASFIWGAIDPSASTKLTFDANASSDVDGQISSYAWDFGDGSIGSGSVAAHTFATAGTYAVTITVTDNAGLSASICQSATTGQFSGGPIKPCADTLKISSPNVFANARSASVSAALTKTDSLPISGRAVDFKLGTGAGTQSCTGTTDSTGVARCTISNVSQPLGPGVVSASFAGDSSYVAASDQATSIIFQFLSVGSFVIGDQNAAVGSAVYFWGSQWASNNALSGGEAPNGLKGFADATSTPPTCGVPWSTDPANSSGPPASVPSYMAVIVSTSITMSGSTIAGNVTKIAIVQTSSGYAPDPGHPGTGIMVAVIAC